MAKPLCALLVGVLIFAVTAVVGTQSSFTQESAQRFAGHSLLNSTSAHMAPQPRSCTPRGLPAWGPRCSAGDPALPRWGPRPFWPFAPRFVGVATGPHIHIGNPLHRFT